MCIYIETPDSVSETMTYFSSSSNSTSCYGISLKWSLRALWNSYVSSHGSLWCELVESFLGNYSLSHRLLPSIAVININAPRSDRSHLRTHTKPYARRGHVDRKATRTSLQAGLCAGTNIAITEKGDTTLKPKWSPLRAPGANNPCTFAVEVTGRKLECSQWTPQ